MKGVCTVLQSDNRSYVMARDKHVMYTQWERGTHKQNRLLVRGGACELRHSELRRDVPTSCEEIFQSYPNARVKYPRQKRH